MKTDTMIPLSECCLRLGIDTTLVLTLEEHGLIGTMTVEQVLYIEVVELTRLEKIARLYNDLEINVPGIVVVTNLLDRIEKLQDEIAMLNNRMRLYE